MTMPATGKAFAVLFQDLARWDVGFFRQVAWRWPAHILRPIDHILERVISEVPRKDYRKGLQIIDKITFDGELISSELDGEDQYKGRLFIARTGQLIYSKIRLKQGSVALIPTEFEGLAVSTEYPVYNIRGESVSPDYLLLVLRSEAFRNVLTGLSHGGSTKTRIHPSDFERLIVPLPELDVQRTIVNFWDQAVANIEAKRRNLALSAAILNSRLLELYRKESPRDVIHSRFFVLDFKDLAEWDLKSGRAAAFRLACPSFRPMGDFIEEATELVRPSDAGEKDWPVYGVSNREGVFLNAYQKGDTFNAAYKRIRKNWFFHNPTRCNVGSLGIVPDVPQDAITSPEYQVWRVKEDIPAPLLPEFIAVLIRTPFFLDLVQFNRVGTVKQRMYTENLCQLRIPYLPEAEQREYAHAREKAIIDLTAAKDRLAQARKDVEAMIIGTKSVESIPEQ